MSVKNNRGKYFSISIEKLEWWHGDSWPIILAFRGDHPVYRTERHPEDEHAPDRVIRTEQIPTDSPDKSVDADEVYHHLKTGS